MFNQIKSFFGKFKRGEAAAPAKPAPAPAQPARKAAPPPPPPPAATKTAAPVPAKPVAAPAATRTAPPPAPVTSVPDETVSLPLKPILAKLPATLSALVKSGGSGEANVSLRKVMSQLPQGAVKITFGELRQASPPGTFLEVASQDQTLVELPLPEILSKLSPSLLQRRAPQKTLDAPAEVGNLFGPRGETLPQAPAAPAPAPAPTAPTAPRAPVPSGPTTTFQKPSTPVPSAPVSRPTVPPPPKPSIPAPVAAPKPSMPSAVAAPKPAAAPVAPISMPKPVAPAPAAAPIPAPKIPFPAPAPAAPTPPASKPAAPVLGAASPVVARGDSTQYFLKQDTIAASDVITLPLASLMDAWPEPVKEEIKKLNVENASVALPMAQLEIALKSGKINFPWKQIANWIQPTPPTVTLQGDTSLELPLKVIAPLFISQHRPTKAQKKVSIGENIPDIFSGVPGAPKPAPAAPVPGPAAAPAPVSSAPAVAAPAPAPVKAPGTPAIPAPSVPKPIPAPGLSKPPSPAAIPAPAIPKPAAVPIPAPVAAPVAKEPTTMGEVFGQPDKKEWSPHEIVQKTTALKGMSGALIATNDGLLVAGQLPAPARAETVGAFLPQIFGRMNQYGKELQFGELSSLQMEYNNVPWLFVKLGAIYFGAMGKAGEALPISQLKVIANDLGKPTK